MDIAVLIADFYGNVAKHTHVHIVPAELPVVRSNKVELVINLLTARTLNFDLPPALLARADEVLQ